MRIELLYGREGLVVDLPPEVRPAVIRKHPMPVLPDPAAAAARALAEPVGSPPLQELARNRKSACILVCDITRPVPNGILLPPLLECLTSAGVAAENIRILVATGLHRPNEGNELRRIIGSDTVLERFRVQNHFARDRAAHADLGTTSDGIPILIDRRFLEADLRIVAGLVEPHFMAGYSGGRKVVAPGVAHQDTILSFHAARILEHPRAENCVIQGNPLHETQIEIVRAVGEVLALNVALDERRRIGFLNFGEVEASHGQAVEFMRRYAEVTVHRRYHTVLTTAAGDPLDRTYYQTIKGMVGVTGILEPGGTVIIASACSEGMGSPELVQSQRLLCRVGPERFMSIIQERPMARIDEWQTEMLLKAARLGNIELYTEGLDKEQVKDVFVRRVSSLEEAVAESVRRHQDLEIAVVPEGPYVIPRCENRGRPRAA